MNILAIGNSYSQDGTRYVHQINIKDIQAVGVGCPGSIDYDNGVVLSASNLGLKNFPLKEKLEEMLHVKVLVNNDARCAALGEYYTLEEHSVDSFIMITLGTGIGGGIILNGKIYAGYDGTAGDLGHMTLKTDGMKCSCGRIGCWEMYASARALACLAEHTAAKNADSVLNVLGRSCDGKFSGKIVFQAISLKDKVAEAVFKEYIKYLGEGIINIIYIFQPEVIVIGGGLSNGELLWDPLEKYIAENSSWLRQEKRTRIRRALLGNDAGIIGAAYLGKQNIHEGV